jgi:hypothetical protein
VLIIFTAAHCPAVELSSRLQRRDPEAGERRRGALTPPDKEKPRRCERRGLRGGGAAVRLSGDNGAPSEARRPIAFRIGVRWVVRCEEVQLRIAGLSLADWNVLGQRGFGDLRGGRRAAVASSA